MLYKSLHFKLVLMLVLFIIIIISIIAAVMLNGVFDFYTKNFNNMMSRALNKDVLNDLTALMDGEDFYSAQRERLRAEQGNLGINDFRDFYILDMNGNYLAGTNDELGRSLIKTPNMIAAMDKKSGDSQSSGQNYMDYAVYLKSPDNSAECIIYVKDTQEEMKSLSWAIFEIMIQVLIIGLFAAIVLAFFLAKAITLPIQKITKSAVKLAGGNFGKKIEAASNDEIGTLILTFNDMAEKLTAMLNQSEELELSRREFIANVSHELKTPLTIIGASAESVSDGRMSEEAKTHFFNMVLRESKRMAIIVQDLLVLSSFDNKKMAWKFTSFETADMAENIYETMLGEAEKNDQTLTFAADPGIPFVYADKARIEQVLMNILSNSIKYTPKGGKIEFFLGICNIKNGETEMPSVKFIVKDNGFGIPKEDLPRIFERFYRVEKARSSEAGGTGLGLSIAKEIIQAHRGTISVESSLGEGTEVTVILPQNADKAEV